MYNHMSNAKNGTLPWPTSLRGWYIISA